MRLLTTLLCAVAACGMLLAGVGYALGPGPASWDARPTGLTAATVLATDGMSSDETGPDGGDMDAAPASRAASSGAARPAG